MYQYFEGDKVFAFLTFSFKLLHFVGVCDKVILSKEVFTMKLFAVVLLLIIVAFLLLALHIFRSSCCRGNAPVARNSPARPRWEQEQRAGKEWFLSQNPTTLTISSHDGLKLSGYYLSADSKNTLILMHGYHADALYEFCPLLKFYYELGYNLLLPDQRAHGKSEGKYLSFGILERQDVRCWAEYITKEFTPDNIFLSGISMGGATVLMSSTLPLPQTVRGIIADCPFADPSLQFRYSLAQKTKLRGSLFLYLCGIWSRVLAGWHFTDFSPTDLVTAKLPLLLLHGTADLTVPHSMSAPVSEYYGGECEILLFDNCPHAYASVFDSEKYHRAVTEFLQKHSK